MSDDGRARATGGIRLGAALAGAGLALAGGAAVVAPGAVDGLPEQYGVVLVIGAVALVAGVVAAADPPVGRRAASLPEVERRQSVPAPGEAFDERLAGLSARRLRTGGPDRRRIRDRLEAAALAALVREGLGRETARARLADGSWTDDPRAAAFFRGDRPPDLVRLGRYARGRSTFAVRARATARVVARRLDDGGGTGRGRGGETRGGQRDAERDAPRGGPP